MQQLFAALSIALFAGPVTSVADCQTFGAAEMEKLRAAGMPVELVEGEIAARVLAAVRRRVETDAWPTRLVIVFDGESAGIGIIVGEVLCAIVSGPADETRQILHQARNQPPGCAAPGSLSQVPSRADTQPFQFWRSAMHLTEVMEAQADRQHASGRDDRGPLRRNFDAPKLSHGDGKVNGGDDKAGERERGEAHPCGPAVTGRADRPDLPAIAQRLRDIADRSERIRLPSPRKPHIFHEDMSEWRASIRLVARQLAGG